MIISHKHKFIFIKTRKTAGTSLEVSLSKYCGPSDIITRISEEDEVIRKKINNKKPQNEFIPFKKYDKLDWVELFFKMKRKRFYNHISAEEIKKYTGPDIWNNYYKFCFERNPWDKIVSWYYYLGKPCSTIKDFILEGYASKVENFNLYSLNSLIVVDKVYKYEELNNSLKDISEKLNINENIILPKAKGTFRKDKRPYKEIITKEEKEMVSKIFAKEISHFKYEF